MLIVPDPTKLFEIETDALGSGVGAVLLQEGHPIAFVSKTLAPLHQQLFVYEKELFAMLHAVKRCHHYLISGHFKIHTDHQSLKFLLAQRLNTPLQHSRLTKLMGYDFEICYKKGKENIAADALSRISAPELNAISLSTISTDLYDRVKHS